MFGQHLDQKLTKTGYRGSSTRWNLVNAPSAIGGLPVATTNFGVDQLSAKERHIARGEIAVVPQHSRMFLES